MNDRRPVDALVCLTYALNFLSKYRDGIHTLPAAFKAAVEERVSVVRFAVSTLAEMDVTRYRREKIELYSGVVFQLDELGTTITSKDPSLQSYYYTGGAAQKCQAIVLAIMRETSFDTGRYQKYLTQIEALGSVIQVFYLRYKVASILINLAKNEFALSQNQIVREISFEPRFKSAGVAILNYFSEVLAHKYPDMEVGVTIRQTGNIVRMTIETESGDREVVENELQEYGLVVLGDKPVDDYIENKTSALLLKNKLELVSLELRQTQEMYRIEKEALSEKNASMEQQLRYMQRVFDKQQDANIDVNSVFAELAREQSEIIGESLNRLCDLVRQGITEADKDEVMREIKSLKAKDPTIIARLNEYILKGAIQGASGNYLFRWINAFGSMF